MAHAGQLKPGDWIEAKRPMPVFADADLMHPSIVHGAGCGAASKDDGIAPSNLKCRCKRIDASVPKSTPMCLIDKRPGALLVHTLGSGPFWIEEASFRRCRRPPEPSRHERRSRIPADYLEVETALGGSRPLKLGRRRRPIQGGEIVFIRSDLRNGEPVPWRYLAQTFVDDVPAALLIDPSIPIDRALALHWDQQQTLPLLKNNTPVRANQLLIPVFPLPDGTEDPGWTSERKRPRPPTTSDRDRAAC